MTATRSYWKGRAVVYRVFDLDGRLIYVGASRNIPGRFDSHRAESWWYELIHRVQVRLHTDMRSAFAAEAVAIQEEQPAFNDKHTGRSTHDWSHWTANDFDVCIAWQKRTWYRSYLPKTRKPRLAWSA